MWRVMSFLKNSLIKNYINVPNGSANPYSYCILTAYINGTFDQI
jgi:hypothetical protein